MIKAIVFDFDGVLLDSVDIKTRAFAKLFESYGEKVVKRVVEYHLKNGGVSRYDKFRHYYKEYLGQELDDKWLEDMCNKFSDIVFEEVLKTNFIDGAKEFIERYFMKYQFYIVSGTPEDELKIIVRLKGLEKYFKGIYGSPARKGEILKKLIKLDFLKPAEVVFVGDSITDFNAAVAANVNFVGVDSGKTTVIEGKRYLFPPQTVVIKNLLGIEMLICPIQQNSSDCKK